MGKQGAGYTADQAANAAVIEKMFGMWGKGEFATSQGEEKFVEVMHTVNLPDATWDFTGPAPDIYKTYTGAKAFKAWMEFLEQFDFPKMTPQIFAGPPGSGLAIMYMNYDMKHKTSSALMEDNQDIFVFNIKDGKIAKAKQYWGNIAGVNEKLGPQLGANGCCTQEQSKCLGVVMATFAQWGEEKFKASQSDEDYNANLSVNWAADHTLDVRGPTSQWHKEYKSGGDIAGTKNWIKFLDAHQFTRMEPVFFPGPPNSKTVYCRMSYDMKYKDVESKDHVDTMRFTLNDDYKVCELKQFWGDPVRVTETFGELWTEP